MNTEGREGLGTQRAVCGVCVSPATPSFDTTSTGNGDPWISQLLSTIGIENWINGLVMQQQGGNSSGGSILNPGYQVIQAIKGNSCLNCKDLIGQRESLINQLQSYLDKLIGVNNAIMRNSQSVSDENFLGFQTKLQTTMGQQQGDAAFKTWNELRQALNSRLLLSNENLHALRCLFSSPVEYALLIRNHADTQTYGQDWGNLDESGSQSIINSATTKSVRKDKDENNLENVLNETTGVFEPGVMHSMVEGQRNEQESLPLAIQKKSPPLVSSSTITASTTPATAAATGTAFAASTSTTGHLRASTLKKHRVGKVSYKAGQNCSKKVSASQPSSSTSAAMHDESSAKWTKCPFFSCTKSFPTPLGMRIHYKRQHKNGSHLKGIKFKEVKLPKLYFCKFCNNGFPYRHNVDRHIRQHCKKVIRTGEGTVEIK